MKTLDEQMLEQAGKGYFFLYTNLSKKEVTKLEGRGFRVIDEEKEKTKKKIFPHRYQVSWLWAQLPNICNEKYSSLNEYDLQYSFTQKLWIITIKNVKKN